MNLGKKMSFLLVFISLWIMPPAVLSASHDPFDHPSFVIGGQYAFGPEGEYVIEQMQREGGRYTTETISAGRTLHILDFAEYPGVRFVYAETRQGMENATQLSTLMAQLPENLRPDVVVHSGISGNAGDGNIGDVYLNRFFVLANLATITPYSVEARYNEAYDPGLGKVVPMIYFPADRKLLELGKQAFRTYAETDVFQEMQALFQSSGDTAQVHTNYIGASSNWFVADAAVIDQWKMHYDIRPKEGGTDYPGEIFYSKVGERLPLGTVDMETAAAAKVFFEHGIPFAAARYPSDSARETALEELSVYLENVADFGGGFMWHWVKEIAAEQSAIAQKTVIEKKRNLPDGFVYLDEIIPSAQFDIRYFTENNFIGERINGYHAPLAIMTKAAAEALQKVHAELEEQGYNLLIYDAYRPQKAVDHFVAWSEDPDDTKMKEQYYPDLDKTQLFQLGYIASQSGHSRGSTVDLTLIDLKTGEELDMGGSFDFFGEKSHHGTDLINEEQTANRNILKEAMEKHGFIAYPEEWWHYTYRDEPFPAKYFDFDIE